MSSYSLVFAVPSSSAAAFSTAPGWPWLAAGLIGLVVGAVSLAAGHSAAGLGAAVPAVAAGSLGPVVVIAAEPLPAGLEGSVGVGDWVLTVVVANPDETEVAGLNVEGGWIAVTA